MYENKNLPFKTSHVFSSYSHITPHCAICPPAVSPWVTVKCWGKASQVRLQYSFTQASFLGPKQQKGEVKWQKSWCNLVKRGVLVICLDVTYRYRIIEMFVRLYYIWMSIPFLENTTYCFFFSVSIKFWQLRMVQNPRPKGTKIPPVLSYCCSYHYFEIRNQHAYWALFSGTLQGTNISLLGQRKIIKSAFGRGYVSSQEGTSNVFFPDLPPTKHKMVNKK